MATFAFVKVKVCENQSQTKGIENSKHIGKIKFVQITKIDDPDFALDQVNLIKLYLFSLNTVLIAFILGFLSFKFICF